jgi:hypothetical protein
METGSLQGIAGGTPAPHGEYATAGMKSHAPILVTGMPRSGTTWIAHMLAAGGDLVYLNEPLNPQHPPGGFPGILNAHVEHRFQYICEDNEDAFLTAYSDMRRFRYHPVAELRQNHRLSDVSRQVHHVRQYLTGRVRSRRLLVADPFAVFSTPWFVNRLGFEVVVVVRRPAATVSSRKHLGWFFDPAELTHQPLLMRDVLTPLEAPTELNGTPTPVIDSGAMLWSSIYASIASYRAHGVRFTLVRHEDLSGDPQAGFAELYERLGLARSDRAEREIDRSTSQANPVQIAPGDPHTVRLDSRANLDSWRSRLSDEELERIRELTDDVAREYYRPGELV